MCKEKGPPLGEQGVAALHLHKGGVMTVTLAQMKNELKRAEKKNNEIRGRISYYLTVGGYSKQELADQLGVCIATLYNKLKRPETFTLEELRRLKLILKLTDSQLLEMI